MRYHSTSNFKPGHLYLTQEEIAVCILTVSKLEQIIKVINIDWTKDKSVRVGDVYSIKPEHIKYEIGF